MFRIELLPAANGDAVWIDYGSAEKPRQIAGRGREHGDGPVQVAGALAHARTELTRQTLRAGACPLQAFAAITGLDLRAVIEALDGLLAGEQPAVRRMTRGRLERYELIDA